ncbi:ribonuclease P protein component [Candidatus Kaiserbacteria bacterium]|nr:ribonuclease P protein component [Candidatus Kaiserbacteria bacterium]
MFPRSQRLSRTAFPKAIKGALRLSSAHFQVIVPRGATGYAVIVPKKTARLSVTRHRLKRRVLGALRALSALPPSLLIYPKASVLDMTASEIRAELIGLLSKTDR